MTLVIFSIILLALSIIVYMLERKKSISVTPTILLALPYTILLIYSILVSYYDISYRSGISTLLPIISITYILIFFNVGFIIKLFINSRYKNKNISRSSDIPQLKNLSIYYILIIISYILILISYIREFGISSNIISNFILMKDKFSSGIISHVVNIANAVIIVVFSNTLIIYKDIKKISKKIIFICILWILFLLVGTAKYTLMMFVGSLIIIYARIFPENIKLYRIIIIAILFPILFIVVYMIRFISNGLSFSELPFEFIISHLSYYLVSPFYAFSNIIENNITGSIGIGIVLAPIINVVRIIFNEPTISTIANFISIGNGSKSTNVFTLFGAIQYEVGYLGTIIILIILSSCIYLLYYKNLYNPSAVNIALYSYLGSSLLIAFFNCFYGVLNVWENIIVMLLIVIIERFKVII